MWADLTIVDAEGKLNTVPVNMDNIVTFTSLEDPAYPKAKSILYPNGGIFQSLPVTATFDELKEAIK